MVNINNNKKICPEEDLLKNQNTCGTGHSRTEKEVEIFINKFQAKKSELSKKSSTFQKISHLDKIEFFIENFLFWKTLSPVFLSCSRSHCSHQ